MNKKTDPSLTTSALHAIHVCLGFPPAEARQAIENGFVEINGVPVKNATDEVIMKVGSVVCGKGTTVWVLERHLANLRSPLHQIPSSQ